MAVKAGPEMPKYQRIADDLKAAIEAGEYAPGARLPGENALAAQYGVATLTARQALRTLADQGLVEPRKGAGFFVQQPFLPIRRHGIQRLSKDRWGAGLSIWSADEDRPLDVDRVAVEQTVPPGHIRRVLGLDETEMACVRSRRYVLEGRPVMIAVSYLPYALVEGSAITQPDTGPGGIYARLADLGHTVARFREEVRSRMPTALEAEALAMPASRSVLKVGRTAFDGTGRVVEINEMTLDSATYVLDYEFDA